MTTAAIDRVAYRQSRARRSTLIALVSTVVFAAVLLFAVTSSPGWPRVRDSFFNLRVGWESLPALLDGLWLNVRVLVVCQVLILIFGLGLAAVRTLRGPVWFPLRALATGYVDLFRGLPLLICLYLVGFGLPGLRLTGLPTNPVLLGGLALVLIYSAYVAEVFRAGIESVHPSQLAAAKSLGLDYRRTMRLVVLPQATRRVIAGAAQRFRRTAKGLRTDLGARRRRRGTGRTDPGRHHLQLHPVCRGRPVVRRARGAFGTSRRLGVQACGYPTGRVVTPTVPILSVRGLVKAYHDRSVLDGVDLDVAEHQVVVLIGASGSGKSTLLRCIDLLEDIDDGQILLDGRDISDPRIDADEARQAMGMVFQSFNLFPHMTALANVALAPRVVHGSTRNDAQERGRELLARVGLADKADAYPDKLSGGQQQRVAIARALAYEPRLLLLDEITSALDPELVGEVLALVGELATSGRTIVMATHEMAFAREVADTVCFLDGGRIVESGSAKQVLTDPQHDRTHQFLRRFTSGH